MPRTIGSPLVTALLAAALWAHSAGAAAQTVSMQRPYQSMFGGSVVDPSVRHTLDLNVSGVGGYEDNVLADASGAPVPPSSDVQSTGSYAGFLAAVEYVWKGRRMQIGANAGTNARYFFEGSEFVPLAQYGAVGIAAQFARQTRLFINQSLALTPAYTYGLFPELGSATPGTPIGAGVPLGDGLVQVYDTQATFSHGVTRRASLEALGNLRYSRSNGDEPERQTLGSYGIGGRYRHTLSQDAALRLGYVYRKGQYGLLDETTPSVVHDIDIGIDYKRALSFSRRSHLDFSMGSALLSGQQTGTVEQKFQYRLIADLGLTRQIGRSWLLRGIYSRGVGYSESFKEPVFSDAVNATASGFFNRRVQFTAQGGMSLGSAGLNQTQDNFTVYSGSVKVQVAVNRSCALLGEYVYYKHDIDNADAVSGTLPPGYDRNGVRVGLTFWMPLMRK